MATIELNEKTLLMPLFEVYPGLKEHLPKINPLFEILNSPIGKMMLQKATIGIAAERTGMSAEKIIEGIQQFIDQQK